jgi:transcription elongation factor Elf1
MRLHLIPSPPPSERKNSRARKATKPPEMLQCPRCDGREVIVTTIGVLMQRGKLKGGTEQVLCALCLMRGERVVLA